MIRARVLFGLLAPLFLIAAAPELLDTLTALIRQIDSLQGQSSCIDEDLQQGPDYRRALSIIARTKAGAA